MLSENDNTVSEDEAKSTVDKDKTGNISKQKREDLLKKIEEIIRQEMDRSGAQEILMSAVQPAELWEERIRLLSPYQVNADVIAKAADDAIFMHCLPSFHDTKTTVGADIAQRFGINEMEVTDEVFESSYSKVFDEAENRMHTIKAVMYATLSEEPWPAK